MTTQLYTEIEKLYTPINFAQLTGLLRVAGVRAISYLSFDRAGGDKMRRSKEVQIVINLASNLIPAFSTLAKLTSCSGRQLPTAGYEAIVDKPLDGP